MFHRVGDFVILWSKDNVFPFVSLQAVTFVGGVWGVPFDIDAAAQAAMIGFNGWGAALACLDTFDTMHVSFTENDGTSVYHYFYAAVTGANAVVNTNEFIGGPDDALGMPVVFGAYVFLPYMNTITGLGVEIGTPLATPVWVQHSGIDPAFTFSGYAFPNSSLVGGKVVIAYSGPSAPSIAGKVRLVSTSDSGVTWNGITVFDIMVPPFGPVGDYITAFLATPDGLGVSGLDPSATQFQRLWLSFTPSAIITLSIVAGCVQASGGTAPYNYTISAGALPGGLTLDPVTGCITGTALVTGTFDFDVTATDVNGVFGAISLQIAVSNGAVAFSVCQNICCTQLLGLGTTGGVSYSFPGSM